MHNTIIAENSAPVFPDCETLILPLGYSAGNNLIGDPTGCEILLQLTDLTGYAGLGAYINNGEPGTSHIPLQADSPAIDAANDTECSDTDQLGNARVDGNGDGLVVCDIGAVEFQPVTAPVGGSVTGMIPSRIKCENKETGQRVTVPLPDDGAWNCEEAGLMFDPGDRIQQRVRGIADGSASVGGTGTGISGITARCDNKSTGERVVIDLNGDNKWDCEAAGLGVHTGDNIVQSVLGTVEQIGPPPDVQTVAIDIKPGNDQNRIRLKPDARVSVAILTDSSFDALQVEPASVRLGPGEATALGHRSEDTDGGGDIDLRLIFDLQDTGIACGDTEATLTGTTFDGQPITGTDSITVICN